MKTPTCSRPSNPERWATYSDQQKEPAQTLTLREIDLLHLIAKVLSNKAIAQALSISENTVKYHARNILQKLNAQNRAEAVTHAIGAGPLNPPPSD